MRKQGASARTFALIAMVLLTLVVFFGFFFYLHVSRESDYLTERNLRELNRLSSALKLRIENYTNKVLPNLVEKAAKENAELCRLEDETQPRKPASEIEGRFACHLRNAAEVAPNLKLISDRIRVTPDNQNKDNDRESELSSISLDPRQEEGSFNVYVSYRELVSLKGVPYVVSFPAVLRMEDLLRGRRGNVFDDIFIAQTGPDGNRVVFQRGRAGLLRLAELPAAKIQKTEPEKESGGKEETKKDEKTSPPPLEVGVSGVFPVELAGTSYKLFVQPLPLMILNRNQFSSGNEKAESDTNWVLGGLVQASRFHDESWALSNPELLLFVFFILLVLAGWPLLKLWTLGPSDELKLADAFLVLVSVLVVSSLLTFSLVDLYAYEQLRTALDNQLGSFARTMAKNFSQELRGLCEMLDRMNKGPGKEDVPPGMGITQTSILYKGGCNTCASTNVPAQRSNKCIVSGAQNVATGTNPGRQGGTCPARSGAKPELPPECCAPLPLLDSGNPYFQMAILVRPDGMQFRKWSIEKFATPLISVTAELLPQHYGPVRLEAAEKHGSAPEGRVRLLS